MLLGFPPFFLVEIHESNGEGNKNTNINVFIALWNGFCSELLTSLEILFLTSEGSDLQKKCPLKTLRRECKKTNAF